MNNVIQKNFSEVDDLSFSTETTCRYPCTGWSSSPMGGDSSSIRSSSLPHPALLHCGQRNFLALLMLSLAIKQQNTTEFNILHIWPVTSHACLSFDLTHFPPALCPEKTMLQQADSPSAWIPNEKHNPWIWPINIHRTIGRWPADPWVRKALIWGATCYATWSQQKQSKIPTKRHYQCSLNKETARKEFTEKKQFVYK